MHGPHRCRQSSRREPRPPAAWPAPRRCSPHAAAIAARTPRRRSRRPRVARARRPERGDRRQPRPHRPDPDRDSRLRRRSRARPAQTSRRSSPTTSAAAACSARSARPPSSRPARRRATAELPELARDRRAGAGHRQGRGRRQQRAGRVPAVGRAAAAADPGHRLHHHVQANWRRIAHIISDVIYERLLGEKGYFDTRIVYVSGTGPRDRRTKRLAIMDQDSENNRFLTDGSWLVLTPRFHPTRDQIAFMSYAQQPPARLPVRPRLRPPAGARRFRGHDLRAALQPGRRQRHHVGRARRRVGHRSGRSRQPAASGG